MLIPSQRQVSCPKNPFSRTVRLSRRAVRPCEAVAHRYMYRCSAAVRVPGPYRPAQANRLTGRFSDQQCDAWGAFENWMHSHSFAHPSVCPYRTDPGSNRKLPVHSRDESAYQLHSSCQHDGPEAHEDGRLSEVTLRASLTHPHAQSACPPRICKQKV